MNIKRLFKKLLYGGSASLTPLEAGVLECVRISIKSQQGEVFGRQIELISLVQRDHSNRMITIYFDDGMPQPLLEDRRENLCIAKVKYSIGSEKFTTSVYTHRGRISSLETHESIDPQSLLMTPDIISVKLVSLSEEGLAADIDREEHE
jgi:hypothetical protein